MWLLTVVLCLLFYVVYKRQQQMNLFKRLRIPGPKPNFIFGNAIDIKNEGTCGIFPKWTKKYGPIVGFYIGGIPQLLITDIELMRHIFIKDFNKFSNKNQLIPGGVHPAPELQTMLVSLLEKKKGSLRNLIRTIAEMLEENYMKIDRRSLTM